MNAYFVILSLFGIWYGINECLFLSSVDRIELIEIAKASAAKSLGIADLDLPTSHRTVPLGKERNCGMAVPNTAKFEVSQIYPNKTFRKTTSRKISLTIFILFTLGYTSQSLNDKIADLKIWDGSYSWKWESNELYFWWPTNHTIGTVPGSLMLQKTPPEWQKSYFSAISAKDCGRG